ncbi:hypothetical protein HDZ31DRAFT_60417 [Schizophyllum fasciatum]
MNSLSDELVQLIFYGLEDPSSFAVTSRRCLALSRDPYVRANYFIARHGPQEALFHALGRGTLLTERVLDVLFGMAHVSRYICQVAIHHYFYTQTHFIKTEWVRGLSLPVFVHFMKLATDKYGDIPRGKGEDDGSLFSAFIFDSKLPGSSRQVNWETIREIVEIYHFIPFSSKDPLMASFPLALSIEPRLLPYAEANGFRMNPKYRDFVFRRMFEKSDGSTFEGVERICNNVRELCRLEDRMFVSRTVAAEVCMECNMNDNAYQALKRLAKHGHLRFELSTLVADLIKSFARTRSVTYASTITILKKLYMDFPSDDAQVRNVMHLVCFLGIDPDTADHAGVADKLRELGLRAMTRTDLLRVFANPFMDKFKCGVDYVEHAVDMGRGKKGMNAAEREEFFDDVARNLLLMGCNGALLKKLAEAYDHVGNTVVVTAHTLKITMDDLPLPEDQEGCQKFKARLCPDLWLPDRPPLVTGKDLQVIENDQSRATEVDDTDTAELGRITQSTLSSAIRCDELSPANRTRRRSLLIYGDVMGSMPTHTRLTVSEWVKITFGHRSAIAAILLTHALLNNYTHDITLLLPSGDPIYLAMSKRPQPDRVPITLEHFQMLARLGRAPHWYLFNEIERGSEFYFSADDYLAPSSPKTGGSSKSRASRRQSLPTPRTSARPLKRPRRSAAKAVVSYVVPDSDEDEKDGRENEEGKSTSSKTAEPPLQKWVTHLGELLRAEERKHKAARKAWETHHDPSVPAPVKNAFHKALSSNMRVLRKLLREQTSSTVGETESVYSDLDDDDDEYQYRPTTRPKRRKTTNNAS